MAGLVAFKRGGPFECPEYSMTLQERLDFVIEEKAKITAQGEALAAQVNAAQQQMGQLGVAMQKLIGQEEMLRDLLAEQSG